MYFVDKINNKLNDSVSLKIYDTRKVKQSVGIYIQKIPGKGVSQKKKTPIKREQTVYSKTIYSAKDVTHNSKIKKIYMHKKNMT